MNLILTLFSFGLSFHVFVKPYLYGCDRGLLYYALAFFYLFFLIFAELSVCQKWGISDRVRGSVSGPILTYRASSRSKWFSCYKPL